VQGRFWNLQRAELLQVSVLEENVTLPPAPGEDAPLIRMLKANMPLGRPKLARDSEELQSLERWVKDGCPD
jgi:hypothetical protein